jgi:hypothetical protein
MGTAAERNARHWKWWGDLPAASHAMIPMDRK